MCVRSPSYSILINGEMVNYFEGKRGLRQGDPISPFLFLIALEYLSRLLNKLDRKAGFYYHPKCHRIDLKHILFADDLFLFSSGRNSFIIAMKDCVKKFLRSFGLSINLAKSHIFVAGMPDSKKVWVEQVLGIAVAKLPVRYIGIPLNAKAINAQDCSSLIDIITSRIHSWSNRYLSRAGRRLLIQSVLQSVIFFWARMCILPKKVLHLVCSICARFLWKGNASGKGGFLVIWTEGCKGKSEGGLGIKDISIMNEAMRLNQLWELSKDVDSVWRAWTREHTGPKLSNKCISIHHNRVVWTGAGNGFTVRDTYDTLVSHSDEVDWKKLVWNRFNSPRSDFHLWLVAKNKLLMRDRLRGMGYTGDGSCVLCRSAQESRDHLFFVCPFAKQLIQSSAGFLKLRGIPIVWHLLIPWFNNLKSIALRIRILAAAISMSAYKVWRARNFYIFREEVSSIPSAIRRIIGCLKMKIGAIDLTKLFSAVRPELNKRSSKRQRRTKLNDETSCSYSETSTSTDNNDVESIELVLNLSKGKERKKTKNGQTGVQLRETPLILNEVIDLLSSEQKSVVTAMSLGPILEMKFTKIPTFLSLKVLQSFDPDTLNLKTESGVLHIHEDDVHSVFGFDLNGQDIDIPKKKGPIFLKLKKSYRVTKEIRYPRNTEIVARLKRTKGVDDWFKVNFLVLFYSILIHLTATTYSHSDILNSIDSELSIPKFNWCKLIL
ncbi:hypothetical protein QQ045_010360 [Rhodiola kirilowii]